MCSSWTGTSQRNTIRTRSRQVAGHNRSKKDPICDVNGIFGGLCRHDVPQLFQGFPEVDCFLYYYFINYHFVFDVDIIVGEGQQYARNLLHAMETRNPSYRQL